VRGSFVEVIGGGQTTCTTNENISNIQEITTVPVTNPDGSVTFITTNITIFITNAPSIICSTNQGSSNAVSFVASVVPGKRLSLVASTVNGRIVYSGNPAKTNLTDISGNWYALKTENHQEFLETFDLMPSGVPNIYNVENGLGAGYDFGGVAMLSARKKIGFALESGSATNFAGIVTYGSLSVSRNTTNANTIGFDLGTAPAASIRYKAVHQ
jgi:hypothetical protein